MASSNRQEGKVYLYCRNIESIQKIQENCQNSRPIANEILDSWPEYENVVDDAVGIFEAFKAVCSKGIVHVFTEQF